MSNNIFSCIVRFRRKNGSICGAGFLVTPKHIVTCAHVVAECLEIDSSSSQIPNAPVYVDFPLSDPDKVIPCQVIFWIPAIGEKGDLAGLLVSQKPENAEPANMIVSDDYWGHSFRAFGFPSGHDSGVYSAGLIRGAQASGWLHIEDVKEPGFRIEPGFSGSPVWDEELSGFVGIIIAAEKKHEIKAAFIIPVIELLNSWPLIGKYGNVVSRKAEILRQSKFTEDINISDDIKIFLLSTDDVSDERGISMNIIERLRYDPLIRDHFTFKVETWEKRGQLSPTFLSFSPKEALNRGLISPSDCDIVAILLWSNLGAVLPSGYYDDNEVELHYLSEWVYYNAVSSFKKQGKPLILVFQKIEEVLLNPDSDSFEQKLSHYKELKEFFNRVTAADENASLCKKLRYKTPSEYQELLEYQVREYIRSLSDRGTEKTSKKILDEKLVLWQGSPFPGLRAFGPEDAPIFFGRNKETDDIISRLSDPNCRFIAVIGASGSGKSSLVGAGVIPRLQTNAIRGSKDWLVVKFTPGEVSDDPLVAMAVKLNRLVDPNIWRTRELVNELQKGEDALERVLIKVLQNSPEWGELLFFIEQFEEVFTQVDPAKAVTFINVLSLLTRTMHVRVVITLRADFYAHCVEIPELAQLLKKGTYPLAIPCREDLYEMITRPASRAGLEFELGLPETILDDTGSEPGSLALMAYALDELYRACQENEYLSRLAYSEFGGVTGSIGSRAEKVYQGLDAHAQEAFPLVFRNLVDIDSKGVATKKRATLSAVTVNDSSKLLFNELTNARLLVQSINEDRIPIIEVAHEALLTSWPRLANWIGDTWRSREVKNIQFSGLDHKQEMARRRMMATERKSSGSVFHPDQGANDGQFCWVVLSSLLYTRVLARTNWRRDDTLGTRSDRTQPAPKEGKNVIFRLRGFKDDDLFEIVKNEEVLIGEFWPNSQSEPFRGINFVRSSSGNWKQDLIPSSDRVFILTINNGVLWLELSRDILPP